MSARRAFADVRLWLLADVQPGLDLGPHETAQGFNFEKIYTGEHYEELIHRSYHQVYLQKHPCYTRRLGYYSDDFIDKHPSVETVPFPCSSNDDDINFGLGMTKFTPSEIEHQLKFPLL